MSIRDFEFYHGVVLTKLVRNDKPITLTMIETNKVGPWCAYTINDEVVIYIKYNSKTTYYNKQDRSVTWSFTFNRDELGRINWLMKKQKVYFALVCGQQSIKSTPMHVCFLKSSELKSCIKLDAKDAEATHVRYLLNSRLRVWGSVNTGEEPILVASNRLENWTLFGS